MAARAIFHGLKAMLDIICLELRVEKSRKEMKIHSDAPTDIV